MAEGAQGGEVGIGNSSRTRGGSLRSKVAHPWSKSFDRSGGTSLPASRCHVPAFSSEAPSPLTSDRYFQNRNGTV